MCTSVHSQRHAYARCKRTDTTKQQFPATDENNRPKWPRSIVHGQERSRANSPSSFFLNCNNFVSSLRSIQIKAVLERRLWEIDVEESPIFSVRSHLRLWKSVEEDIMLKKLYRHGMGLFVQGNCFSCFLYDKRDRKSTN